MALSIRGYSGPISIKSRTDSGDEVQAVDVAAALPAGTNNIGDVDVASLPGGSVTPGDSLSNPTTHGAVISHGLRYDAVAGTWHREHSGRELSTSDVLASAARTSSTSSPNLSSRGSRGALFLMNITVAPATGGDLTFNLYARAASNSNMRLFSRTVTQSTGATAWYFFYYPGNRMASDGTAVTELTRLVWLNGPALPPRFYVNVTHSDSESWTYSVEATLVP